MCTKALISAIRGMGKDSFSGLMESTIQEIGEMVIVMEMEYGQINMEIAITVLG